MLLLCELECPQETLNLKTLRSVRVQLNNEFIENKGGRLSIKKFISYIYIMNYFFNLELKMYSILT